jgi:hypothetical protein
MRVVLRFKLQEHLLELLMASCFGKRFFHRKIPIPLCESEKRRGVFLEMKYLLRAGKSNIPTPFMYWQIETLLYGDRLCKILCKVKWRYLFVKSGDAV